MNSTATAKTALFLGLLAIAAFCGSPAHAVPPLPEGPLRQPRADFCAWEIDYSYASDLKPKTDQTGASPVSNLPPRTITITWTKPLWHSVTTDTGGAKMEQWFDGTIRVFIEQNSAPSYIPKDFYSRLSSQFPDFGAANFPDCDWVTSATYVGTESLNGTPCLVFAKNGMKIWIDASRRTPVQWRRGDETRVYHQLPPPVDKINLPPVIHQFCYDFEHALELARRPIPR